MSNKEKRIEILTKIELKNTIHRLSSEIIDRVSNVEDMLLMGIPTRGVYLSDVLASKIKEIFGIKVRKGIIDPTFYRDDQSRISTRLIKSTNIPFTLENKQIILIDDVIYTGRTIRAALDALNSWGRPKKIMLLVMVDRGNRELPIQPDFCGKKLKTDKTESIELRLDLIDNEEGVFLVRN
tara:strand:+ start:4018 stop:4560 length:543 start_codon:yes stop_codon:yes gene_type:complete